ncbi:protein of unknown function [Natronincola peptidivorans]|uniref:DUF4258 domain-containing protein n=1 Tax=Natronincola peptidivorans TaxID=426128 RepID=A0A1I0E0L3_9FIRM|nr:DUF4258 domain-containing protein [Natronincola peptidivorans]SET38496.1 protein of unknown function [Natronincola peptidivorans]
MPSNSILPEPVKNKYSQEIIFIRNCAKSNQIKISDHCNRKISKRKIRLSDVYESIRNGVVMEVQDFERDVKVLFQDCANKPPNFFVAVAIKSTFGLCVTVYLPDPEKWVLESSDQWRRKKVNV